MKQVLDAPFLGKKMSVKATEGNLAAMVERIVPAVEDWDGWVG
jgi:hypothetical protein